MNYINQIKYIAWSLKNNYCSLEDLFYNPQYTTIINHLLNKNYEFFSFLSTINQLIIKFYSSFNDNKFWDFLYNNLKTQEKIQYLKKTFWFQIGFSILLLIFLLIFFIFYFKSWPLVLSLMVFNGSFIYFLYKYIRNQHNDYYSNIEKYFLLINILSHNDIKNFSHHKNYTDIINHDIKYILENYYNIYNYKDLYQLFQWIYHEINFLGESYYHWVERSSIIINQSVIGIIMINGLVLLINILWNNSTGIL